MNLVGKYHILVVEDNELNRMISGIFLSKMNCTYSFALHGLDAIRILQEEKFDLILMDINMPLMDGLSATRLIRAHASAISTLPIVVHSADDVNESRQKAIDAGANAYMPKPVDFQTFKAFLVENLMKPVVA